MYQEERWLLQEKYYGLESEAFQADRKRLAAGEPLAYVIGTVPFLDCTIHLDSHPLIPRPETEYWTKQCIDKLKSQDRAPFTVLDLCAGSGCIGVAIAKALPQCNVTFAELESHHLPTIHHNLCANCPPCSVANCTVVHSDLFTNVDDRFDCIVCNPPYIDPALGRVSNSVREHEPDVALYGGLNGLAIIKQIIRAAPHYLTSQGSLWIEHEPEQSNAICQFARENNFAECVTHTDQYRTPRFTICSMAL